MYKNTPFILFERYKKYDTDKVSSCRCHVDVLTLIKASLVPDLYPLLIRCVSLFSLGIIVKSIFYSFLLKRSFALSNIENPKLGKFFLYSFFKEQI
ncbi:hypothetical protein Bcop_1356 [Bacteroides coprosuis DSM 18011]|uniref:Uncharacterized protein n=1 Tax=Bacteroides coprosuis DSM 18011 TaxID=679937 RepID=F3ZNX7_9BACE|nr:hypothetical protein Bcop_1356 [Bacteroides coprosuis DSM 18011]